MDKDTIDLLKSPSKLVGLNQVKKGLSEGGVRCVIVAEDADSFIKNKIVAQAKKYRAEVRWCPSMDELGKLSGIDVGAAVVGMVK